VSEIVKWTLVGWCAFSAIVVITQVGKPRGPLTGGTAAFAATCCALEIVGILAYWGGGNG
jgi:hypothetical protein